jgi:rubrerythrin
MPFDRSALHQASAREAESAARSLAAAERAVDEGRLNVAKVLRAHALSARQRALALARLGDEGEPSTAAVQQALLDAHHTELTLADATGAAADAILRSAQSSAAILQTTAESLASERDVLESQVAQIVWGCEVCGFIIEANRPEICPSCGCIGGEFALFAPFFSGTTDHIARKQPADIIKQLNGDGALLSSALAGHDDEALRARPRDGEWCAKEIAGHMLDIADLALRRLRAAVKGEEPPQERTLLPWKLLDNENYPGTPAEQIAARFSASVDELATLLEGLAPADWRKRINMMSGNTLAVDVGSWVANHNTAHLRQIEARLAVTK